MTHFEIRAKDGLARLGRFTTKHGTVKTPLLMPVVHPGKSVIKAPELVSHYGFQMVITNSYIIRSHERFRNIAVEKGVHELLNFSGPIMTDSGTFQMYFHSLPDEEIDPLEIVEFQKSIGTDIGTILDVFSDPKVGKTKVEQDMKISLERAKLSVDMKEDMMLAGTVQGGSYPDLREISAKGLASLDFDVHPIGGVVPFMEQYRYADIVRATLAAKKHLPPDRPVHLFGCGHPMFFAQAALLGCDFFDSASYAKFAEGGRMLHPTGTIHLNQLNELPCDCPVCSNTTAPEFKTLDKTERDLQLMKHNLYVTSAEMRRVRQAISEGKLFELAATRARSHPALLEAFRVMMEYSQIMIDSDPIGKTSSIFYTGSETVMRSEVVSFYQRLYELYPYRNTNTIILVPDNANRPYSESASIIIDEVRRRKPDDLILLFVTPIGIVPWELEHVHPAQQGVFPETIDSSSLEIVQQRLHKFLDSISFENLLWFRRNAATNALSDSFKDSGKIVIAETASDLIGAIDDKPDEKQDWIKRKLRAVLTYQWGPEVASMVNLEGLSIDISRSTGKIRHVRLGSEIILTLVPTTGLFTATYEGGLQLLKHGLDPKYIVRLDDEVREYVADGKSALAKFITHAHPNLRAGEEVVVVDSSNTLLGVGKALLNGHEMIAFQRGVAVNIRHSKKS
ncbi:MAG: tRNA guanosine(15) transglycosylase TgtA [Candidatus Thorarchaeota archaeon]|nr:MAG: tRNA guanosine(15) transglycosylase TgtA [Candidatus Thorarchaeota archaeon]